MTLQVELVVPEGEVWSGPARLVIAKTLDGDIGVLTGHTPVLGILAEGSVVQIKPEEGAAGNGGDGGGGGGEVTAAVGGGFFSVADNRVSILAHQAQLGREVDTAAARAALDTALQDAQASPEGDEEPADVRYFRALLRAAGEPDDRA
jgi:F-type H+-transporting ATPase subunit epsilon